MLKKIGVLFTTLLILSIACKKEEICTDNKSFEVISFQIKINDENIGLFPEEGKNTSTTIGSVRNQLMFIPEKKFVYGENQSQFSFDIFSSAYAKRCVEVENSRTTFDVNKTALILDRDLDLSIFNLDGLDGFVLKGQNLLDNQKLRSGILKEVIENNHIHSGFEFPITLSKAFLAPFDGQELKITLKMTSTIGIEMESTVDVVVDVNA